MSAEEIFRLYLIFSVSCCLLNLTVWIIWASVGESIMKDFLNNKRLLTIKCVECIIFPPITLFETFSFMWAVIVLHYELRQTEKCIKKTEEFLTRLQKLNETKDETECQKIIEEINK